MILRYTREKLGAFTEEIFRLKESEFPYRHPKEALQRLENALLADRDAIGELDGSNPDVVAVKCSLVLAKLFRFMPLLGFILRATNVRNAFEVSGPLLRIACQLLEPSNENQKRKKRTTRLLLSSEWQYSPFIYRREVLGNELPAFVLIGFPAPESSNPLLVPLAGHELGHALWTRRNISPIIENAIAVEIIDLILNRYWKEYQQLFRNIKVSPQDFPNDIEATQSWFLAHQWALRHAEETFCDCVGLRLFGSSYLRAFAYLLSPSRVGARSPHYPNIGTRVKRIVAAAGLMGIRVESKFESLFDDLPQPFLSDTDLFKLRLADEATGRIHSKLVDQADEIVNLASIPKPHTVTAVPVPRGTLPTNLQERPEHSSSTDSEACMTEAAHTTTTPPVESTAASPSPDGVLLEEERILRCFKKAVPAESVSGVVEIINAAWLAYDDLDLWADYPHLLADRQATLKDLVLKNLEIFEIEQIVAETDAEEDQKAQHAEI